MSYWPLVCWWTHGSKLQLLWRCCCEPLGPRFRFLGVCTQGWNPWVTWKPSKEHEDFCGGCTLLHQLVSRAPLCTHGLSPLYCLPGGRSWGTPLISRWAQLLGDGGGEEGGEAEGHPPPMRPSRRTASPLKPASPRGVWKMLPFLPRGLDGSPQAPCCP